MFRLAMRSLPRPGMEPGMTGAGRKGRGSPGLLVTWTSFLPLTCAATNGVFVPIINTAPANDTSNKRKMLI
jgi:hypothetical protein